MVKLVNKTASQSVITSAKERLSTVIEQLPQEETRELLDFAEFLLFKKRTEK